MKFTISINQKSAVDSGMPIDIIDLAIVDYTKSWIASRKCDVIITEAGEFHWIDYGTLIKKMPILGIKSKDVISRRFNALCDHGILEKHYDRKSSRAFFRFGEKFGLLEWDGDDSEGSTQKSEGSTLESGGVDSKVGGGSTQKSDYYNTIYSNKKIIRDSTREFLDLIEREPESATAKTAFYFMKLGWKPKESVEDLREWIVELAESRKVNAEELKHAVKEWYLYWSAHPEKPVKNHKNSLGNTPLLNKDKWKKN